MAKNDNLGDFIADLAFSIKGKCGIPQSTLINAQNLSKTLDNATFTGINLQEIGISAAVENEYNTSFQMGIDYAKEIQKTWNNPTNIQFKYNNDLRLKFFPLVDLSQVTNGFQAFASALNLEVVADMNMPNIKNMNQMFNNCTRLEYLGRITTPLAEDMYFAFQGCSKLKDIPKGLDFSHATSVANCFGNCVQLKNITSLIDLQNCSNGNSLFYSCENIEHITNLKNVNKIVNAQQMFSACRKLQDINTDLQFDSLKIGTLMFFQCFVLKQIPAINTSNATDLSNMFARCNAIATIELTSVENVSNFDGIFVDCRALKNLTFTRWKSNNIGIAQSPNLTPLSIHNIIVTALGKDDGAAQRTLTLHATAKAAWAAAYPGDMAVAQGKLITIA